MLDLPIAEINRPLLHFGRGVPDGELGRWVIERSVLLGAPNNKCFYIPNAFGHMARLANMWSSKGSGSRLRTSMQLIGVKEGGGEGSCSPLQIRTTFQISRAQPDTSSDTVLC